MGVTTELYFSVSINIISRLAIGSNYAFSKVNPNLFLGIGK